MVWAVIVAGGTGLLLGLWLRLPAVLAASVVAVFAGVALTALSNWSLFTSAMYCMSLLTALQVGYLVGGGLSCVIFRAGSN
jgi:hypothetical protein